MAASYENTHWVQIDEEATLEYWRRFRMTKRCNVYSKNKDKRGYFLLRVGFDSDPPAMGRPKPTSPTYEGHHYVIRCQTGALLGAAEAILRTKLGLPLRIVADDTPSTAR